MAQNLKWTKEAIKNYKAAGETMKAKGFRAMREVKDVDCGIALTFWAGTGLDCRTVIQQTWVDTGDVIFFAATEEFSEVTA